MGRRAYRPSTLEAEAGGFYSEVSLGYVARPCLDESKPHKMQTKELLSHTHLALFV